MAILGKGSMRNKEKEEELRNTGDPKHNHLRQELHVEISTFAPAADAYARIAHALSEVKRFLVPDYYDDIRQHQLRELAILNGDRKHGGHDAGNGTESTSPLSSPAASSPPPPAEPLRLIPPTTASQLHSPHNPNVHLPSNAGVNGRISRIAYPAYRPTSSILTSAYRRVSLYGSMEADPPTLVLPKHSEPGYQEAFPEEFYDPLYDGEFPPLAETKDTKFIAPISAHPQERHYDQSFYGESWQPSTNCIGRRMKTFSMRTIQPAFYRNKPYSMSPCHLVQ